jgi:hypothetical protein
MFIDFVTGLTVLLSLFSGGNSTPEPVVGAFGDPFLSVQLAASPTNTYILTTDGTNNSWAAPGAGTADGTWSTTSADYWKTVRNFFSTTSVDYWETTQAPRGADGTFSTTSANFWSSLGLSWSTTSATYFETQQTARTADDLTNNSIEDLNDVAAMTENLGDLLYWNGSTWTDLATSSLNINFSNLVGAATDAQVPDTITLTNITQITNRAISDTSGTLLIGRGGTGQTTFTSSQLLYGNGTAALSSVATTSLTATTPLSLSQPISVIGSSASAIAIANAVADGSTKGAASFTAADFDATTGNISIDYTNGQAASASVKGFLTAANWATFNNKWDLASSTIPINKGGTNLTAVGASSTVLTTNGTIMIWQSIVSYVESTIAAASLVLTGNWNFGGATGLEMPNGAAPVVDAIGELALDTTANELLFATSTNAAAPAVIKPYTVIAFSYASSSQGIGTTTRSLAPADAAGYFDSIQCDSNSFLRVMLYDGTNRMNDLVASGTVGTVKLTENQSLTSGEAIRVDIGTTSAVTSGVYLGCRAKYIYTRN